MHNICYRMFSGNVSRETITSEVREIVSNSGDGYGTERITFHSSTVCDDYESAAAFLNDRANGFYPGTAVQYYDVSGVVSKKIQELLAKIGEVQDAKHEYIAAHSVTKFAADFIGCKQCGSKLSRAHLKNDICPVCRNDLRSATTLERIVRYDEKTKELQNKLRQERIKGKDKAAVRWLVRYEYHS